MKHCATELIKASSGVDVTFRATKLLSTTVC